MLYAHVFSITILPVQGIYLINKTRNLKKTLKWAVEPIIALLLYTPWYLITRKIFLDFYANDMWLVKLDSLMVLYLPYTWLNGFYTSTIGFVAVSIALILIIKQLIKNFKDQKTWLLISWMVLPALITMAYSLLIRPVVIPRYLIFSSIAYFILIANSIAKIPKKKAIAIFIVLVLLISFSAAKELIGREKIDWKKISDEVKNIRDDSTIIISPGQYVLTFGYHFKPECFDNKAYYCLEQDHIWSLWGEDSLRVLNQTGELKDRIIYIRLNHRTIHQADLYTSLIKEYDYENVSEENTKRKYDDAIVRMIVLEK
jgi:hypothetical protein